MSPADIQAFLVILIVITLVQFLVPVGCSDPACDNTHQMHRVRERMAHRERMAKLDHDENHVLTGIPDPKCRWCLPNK
jgi:predicted lipase